MLWTPNRHVAIKASFYKYDLERNRLFISLGDVVADGTMRETRPQCLRLEFPASRASQVPGTCIQRHQPHRRRGKDIGH